MAAKLIAGHLAIFAVAVGVGCASRSQVSLISSKTLAVTRVNSANATAKGLTRGEDCQHIIVIIPTSGVPTLDEALDRALEPKQANLLVNGSVTYQYLLIPAVYARSCWTAEGEAYDVSE